jgi:arsenate reductase
MAEGFLKSFDDRLEVASAGTRPADRVHPRATQVMAEVGVDLSQNYPKTVDELLDQSYDFVITVCDHARETCPVFVGKVQQLLHIGFDDPAEARGSEAYVLSEFRRIRDEIGDRFKQFYDDNIEQKQR